MLRCLTSSVLRTQDIKRGHVVWQLRHTLYLLVVAEDGNSVGPALKDVLILEVGSKPHRVWLRRIASCCIAARAYVGCDPLLEIETALGEV